MPYRVFPFRNRIGYAGRAESGDCRNLHATYISRIPTWVDMPRKPKNVEKGWGPLRVAVEAARSSSSLAHLAASAQVATKTLAQVRKGRPADIELADARTRSGLAESLTRLAIYLKVEFADAIAEFGLSYTDPAVKNGVERALRTAQRPQMVDDYTLNEMELARLESMAEECTMTVGILDWAPLHDMKDEHWPFGKTFMRRLIHSINPFWTFDPKTVRGIGKAIDGMVADERQANEPRYHVVFGLYATAFRRQSGLDFVSVPGLSIELGAIAARGMNWREIIDPPGRKPVALVLEREAGFHLLRGASDYRPADVLTVVERAPDRIAAELLLAAQKPRDQDVIFVADAFTCAEVLAAIKSNAWSASWPSGRGYPTEAQIEQYRFVIDGDEKDGERWAPRYEVSIAVRADSPRLRELLTAAICVDMFDHARLATAQLYQDLFAAADPKHLVLDEISFASSLGSRRALRFADAWEKVVTDALARNPVSKIKPPPIIDILRNSHRSGSTSS